MTMDHTVAWRLSDLNLERRKADQKLQEMHNFDARNLNNGKKTSKDQTEVLSKQIDKCNSDAAKLEKELIDLFHGFWILKVHLEKEALSKTPDENESRLNSLEKAIEENKINQEKEMKEFDETNAKNIQKFEDEIDTLIDEAKHSYERKVTENNEVNERLSQDVTTLTTGNVSKKHMLKECENQNKFCRDRNYCQSYIGEVCLYLQANMYHYVLPDQFAEDMPYKVKDIEEDIEDEELHETQVERQEASKRWEDLKKKLSWDPLLEGTLEVLQKEESPMHPPEGLTVKEAERVAKEMNQQGRLRGRTSYEKVKKIIEMWKTSATLVQSLQ